MRAALAMIVVSISSLGSAFVVPVPRYISRRTMVRGTGPADGSGSDGQQDAYAYEQPANSVKSMTSLKDTGDGSSKIYEISSSAEEDRDRSFEELAAYEQPSDNDDETKIYEGSSPAEEDRDRGFDELMDGNNRINVKELLQDPAQSMGLAQGQQTTSEINTQGEQEAESNEEELTDKQQLQDGVTPSGYGAPEHNT